MYDFHKQNRKTNYGQVFYHPLFQKDMKILLTKICRKSNENHLKKGSGKPENKAEGNKKRVVKVKSKS